MAKLTVVEAINLALKQAMASDDRVLVLGRGRRKKHVHLVTQRAKALRKMIDHCMGGRLFGGSADDTEHV